MNPNKNLQEKYISFKKKSALFGLQSLVCMIHSVDFYWYQWAVKPRQGTNANWIGFVLKPTDTFLDLVSKNKNIVFVKNGANLDSIAKTTCILVYTQLVSFTVFFLDKYLVSFSLKKNAESLLNSTSGLFNKLKRSVTGTFTVFWYIFVLFIMLIVII